MSNVKLLSRAYFLLHIIYFPRYIISCSNSFITFDVVTSDLARQVYPKVEGLMIGLELSPDNKFAAAWTNNNQTILLNTLISEFFIIDSPLKGKETVQGLVVLDTNLIIYGQRTWCILDLKGKITKTNFFVGDGEIHFIKMLETLDSYSMIRLERLYFKDKQNPSLHNQLDWRPGRPQDGAGDLQGGRACGRPGGSQRHHLQ